MHSAAVVGTGLIGTSIALVLSGQGVAVYLSDSDEDAARTAAARGAGTLEAPAGPVDLAVIAVPPACTGQVLAACQRQGLARKFMDVAGVKVGPCRHLDALGCDPTSYVGSHPMAGREVSGPLGADANLFEGRPWVLTPTPDTATDTLNLALEVIALCDAVPVVMDATAHDQAVALISHAPQLLASLLAARLEYAEESTVRLAGQGLRDVTRIAASEPRMWLDILSTNAGVVADILDDMAADLVGTIVALRAMEAADEDKRRAGRDWIADVLRRGNAGHGRIPGKHGSAPVRYERVAVLVGDQPGELARLFADAGAAEVNIEDVDIEHSVGQATGLIYLSVKPSSVPPLVGVLSTRGWTIAHERTR